MYFMVLPWTLDFLIGFGTDIPAMRRGGGDITVPALIEKVGVANIPIFKGNPPQAANGDLWIDATRGQLKMMFDGHVRVIALRSEKLLAAEIKLSTYIDMVVTMLLIFGLSFQLPLVVLALERIGIVEMETLKSGRRYVYFILAIASAVITPGGDIPTMLLLTVPLCGLYELGIWLAKMGRKRALT
jgi:sec-independent protein translocase protein TatC